MNIQTRATKSLQKGFTLVEVIVVAVIIAVLAGVAVPLYLGYVEDSRENSAANAAGAIATFCGACQNTAGVLAFAGSNAAPAVQITCTPTTGSNATSILKPQAIIINITPPTTPGGTGLVTGKHSASPSATLASSYNY